MALKNPGISSTNVMPEFWSGFILTPTTFTDTIENLKLAATWQTAIKAAVGSRVYLFPTAVEGENADEEDTYQTTSIGRKLFVRSGIYSHKFLLNIGLPQYRNIVSFHNTNWRVFIIDTEENMLFSSSDGVNGKGLQCQVFVEKLRRNDGSNKTLAVVSIDLIKPGELNNYGKIIPGAFVNDLVALTTVDLAVEGTPSATSYTIKVTNPNDDTPVLGLVQADFTQLSGVSGMTDNEDGTYTFAGTGMSTGSVNLVAASSLSIDAYESSGAVTVTISQ